MRSASWQSSARDEGRKLRRPAILVLLISGAASLLLAGCGASDGDEGIAAFPPVKQTTLPETALLADGGTLFNQRDAGLESARMQLGPATDLEHSGTPYLFEQIVPKA